MKKLLFNGIELDLKICSYVSEAGDSNWVEFYYGTEIIRKKKYILFGDVIETENPKLLFTIYANYNDLTLSKRWWREKISEKFEVINRKEELLKGELI